MYFPLADLSLITLIEDAGADNKLVGVGITIPSLAYALRKCKRGRLFPFGWIHVLRAIKRHKTNIVDLLLVGVLPEYRSREPMRCSSPTSFRAIRSTDSSGASRRWS